MNSKKGIFFLGYSYVYHNELPDKPGDEKRDFVVLQDQSQIPALIDKGTELM
jgi:hypothetical protein